MVLCGAAGTGKSSITSALVGYLNDQEKGYRISAPTGRAARILGRKANAITSTIHSMIYVPNTGNSNGQVEFKLKSKIDAKPVVYIIDEASMIPSLKSGGNELFVTDNSLLKDLITFVKNANAKNKLIFLGDTYQLPPIGEKDSLALQASYLESEYGLTGTSHLLTEVKRQEDGSYVLTNANQIKGAIDRGESRCEIAGEKSKNIYQAAQNYMKDFQENGFEHTVSIGVSHKANGFFNKLVREEMFGLSSNVLEPGDLLMVNQNWSRDEDRLFNGDHVELIKVELDKIEVVAGLSFVPVEVRPVSGVSNDLIISDYALLDCILLPGGNIDFKKDGELRRQRYAKNQIFRQSGMPGDDRYVGALRLTYGHSITCNKAQGGEWDKVFINTWGIPTLQWQYTAVTRAISQVERY